MKLIAPDYYSSFACLMGQCRHSCCIGWEIDIDEASLERYKRLPAETWERFSRVIDQSGESACFRLRENGRCPFLREDGLCDMIVELGEESLCQICDDHPRFRNFFADRTEIGLGLCCEAAGALILSKKEPVMLTVLEDDGADDAADPDEAELLDLRGELISLMQTRSLPLQARISRLTELCGIDPSKRSMAQWAKCFFALERLDAEWDVRLERLSKDAGEISPAWDEAFEQLMVYLLYRHLPDAMEDGDADGRTAFCVLIWQMIRSMFAAGAQTMDELIELCRLYSGEIEYSDENVYTILSELDLLRG